MKASIILQALSYCGIAAGAWGVVPIGKDYPFEEVFGDEPMGEFEPGTYVYVNASHISDEAFEYLENMSDQVLFGPDPEQECTILLKVE